MYNFDVLCITRAICYTFFYASPNKYIYGDGVGCADSVDPLGWDESSATVGYCGGSFEQTWVGPYVSSSAGFLGEYDSTTSAVDRRHRNVGFRICLHNADFPILESAEVLQLQQSHL